MSCCDRAVCKGCISKWRRINAGPVKINRHHSEEKLPDTRRCPFCNAIGHNCASSRRIFDRGASLVN